MQRYLLLEGGLELLQFVLIHNVCCGAGVCFHLSFHPANANLNRSMVECVSVFDLSAWSWNAKSVSDDSSCSSSLTYLAEDCWLCCESFGFFLLLHIRAKWLFFEQQPHVFPEAGHCDRGPLWSNPQNCQELLFLSSCVGLGFSLSLGFWCLFWYTLLTWFRAGGTEGRVFSISWAWRSMFSLFAACADNCCNVYLFIIASWRSFLSRMVCRILLQMTSSGSKKPHFVTWSCKRTWYWATDSASFWHIFSNLIRVQSGLTMGMKWLSSLAMSFSYSFRL